MRAFMTLCNKRERERERESKNLYRYKFQTHTYTQKVQSKSQDKNNKTDEGLMLYNNDMWSVRIIECYEILTPCTHIEVTKKKTLQKYNKEKRKIW